MLSTSTQLRMNLPTANEALEAIALGIVLQNSWHALLVQSFVRILCTLYFQTGPDHELKMWCPVELLPIACALLCPINISSLCLQTSVFDLFPLLI